MNIRHLNLRKPAIIAMIATALAGCATDGGKEAAFDKRNPLAVIQIAKNAQKSAGDCAVTVKIANRMNVAWDGVSYHLSMHNKRGVSIGKLIGSPRKPTKPGNELTDSGQVLGAKCEDVTGTALVYFGYYPAGKKQVHAHNHTVRVELK